MTPDSAVNAVVTEPMTPADVSIPEESAAVEEGTVEEGTVEKGAAEELTVRAGPIEASGLWPVFGNRNFLTLWSGQVFSQMADKIYL
ncbi:MAG: arabinose efflux permease, partial [Cyanobacteria bacterium J06635_11]